MKTSLLDCLAFALTDYDHSNIQYSFLPQIVLAKKSHYIAWKKLKSKTRNEPNAKREREKDP